MSRRRVALAGAVAVALYMISAAVSGHLSPLARLPLLDGIAPPQPYRWVDPPDALSESNRPPTAGTFRVELTGNGSKTAVFTTDDAQVTLILAKGAIAPARGQDSVEVTMTPVAPTGIGDPDPPLRVVGNVVEIRASYRPSGESVTDVGDDARIVLVYPFTPGEHGAHSIVTSLDGLRWIAAETNDLPSIQQADALIDSLGYVAVARAPAPSTPGGGTDAGASNVATIAIVAGLVVLTVATAITLGRGKGHGSPSTVRRRNEPRRRRR